MREVSSAITWDLWAFMRSSFEVGKHFEIHVVLQNAVNFNESSKQVHACPRNIHTKVLQMICIFIFLFISKPSLSHQPIVIPEMAFIGLSLVLWRWACDGLGDPATQFCCQLGTGRAGVCEYRLGGGTGAIGWGEKPSKLQPFIYLLHQHSILYPRGGSSGRDHPRSTVSHRPVCWAD